MTHWATEYIGCPWQYGAEGPESYDCWGFVRTVQSKHFDVTLPPIPEYHSWREANELIRTHYERDKWTRVTAPKEGDLVLMCRNRLPVHIGVVISANDRLGILHCIQQSGVVYNTLPSLRSNGWGGVMFYRRSV